MLNVRSQFVAAVGNHAAAAADTGVVEQQVDLVDLVAVGHLVAKPLDLRPVGNIGDVRRDPEPLRQSRRLAQRLRFRQAGRRDVAHCDIAGFRHQLADQLAAHPAAAAGDYRGPPREFGHVCVPPLPADADPRYGPQPTLSAGGGLKGSLDRAMNFTAWLKNQMPEPRKVRGGQLDRSGSNPRPPAPGAVARLPRSSHSASLVQPAGIEYWASLAQISTVPSRPTVRCCRECRSYAVGRQNSGKSTSPTTEPTEQPMHRATTLPVSEQTCSPEHYATLFVSLELSRSTWVATTLAPGSTKMSKHTLVGGDGRKLLDLLARLKTRAEQRISAPVKVVAIHEVGLDGFWIHRLLEANGVESHVVDPASIAVPRRHRRAKTDAIDGETLLRTLMAWQRGEPRVCAMTVPPSPSEEDRRRMTRERAKLLQERIRHTNRIRGLLFGQGITNYNPVHKNRRKNLEQLRTGDGRSVPVHLKSAILREIDRLELVLRQIGEVEAERDEMLQLAQASSPAAPTDAAQGHWPGIRYRALP